MNGKVKKTEQEQKEGEKLYIKRKLRDYQPNIMCGLCLDTNLNQL